MVGDSLKFPNEGDNVIEGEHAHRLGRFIAGVDPSCRSSLRDYLFPRRARLKGKQGACVLRLAIDLLRFLQFAVEVQQAPQVDTRSKVPTVRLQRRDVSGTRRRLVG
jgi:hypothetical protein